MSTTRRSMVLPAIWLCAALALLVGAAACDMLPVPTPLPRPTDTPLPTPAPLIPAPTPARTATPRPETETLRPRAGSACAAAFRAPVREGQVTAPLAILFEFSGGWEVSSLGGERDHEIRARAAADVQGLACIKSTATQVVTYTNGSPGYARAWDVRLVQWPQGTVVGAAQFAGDDPPASSTTSAWGDDPAPSFLEWLWPRLRGAPLLIKGHFAAVAFAPDGQTLATAVRPGTVTLRDAATGQVRSTLPALTERVTSLAFAPDGRTLAATARDDAVRLWNMPAWGIIQTLNRGRSLGDALAFTPDSKVLAAGTDDPLWGVQLWDAQSGQLIGTLPRLDNVASSLAFAPGGALLAVGEGRGAAALWEVESGRQLYRFAPPIQFGQPATVAFAPDGQTLFVGGGDATVRLHDVATGRPLRTFAGHEELLTSMALSPDGRLLASGDYAATVHLWDVASGRIVRTYSTPGDVISLAFAPDGKRLAVVSDVYDETGPGLIVWDLATLP